MVYELWVRDQTHRLCAYAFLPVDDDYVINRELFCEGLELDARITAETAEEAEALLTRYLTAT